jgi:hypothetical protein
MQNILGEEDSLEFNQEKIDELADILQNSLKCFLGYSVVSTGSEGTGKTM